MISTIKYKPLLLFFVGSGSLMLTGLLLAKENSLMQILLLQWCVISGIFLVYRFNDFIDQTKEFRFYFRKFLNVKLHLIFVFQFVLITLPVSVYLLSSFRIIVLGAMCALGLLYSLSFFWNRKNYRIKNLLFVKNICIGFSWGALILVGAGYIDMNAVLSLFLFTSLQVIIGSIIRDIPDVEKDKSDNVNSIPVIYGQQKAINILHFINIVSFLSVFISGTDIHFLILMLSVVCWRAYSISRLTNNSNVVLWTQTLNILNCFFIFLILFIQYAYEYFSKY